MKKRCVQVLIAVVLCCCLLLCKGNGFSHAEQQGNYQVNYDAERQRAYFFGTYFGFSDVTLSVEFYGELSHVTETVGGKTVCRITDRNFLSLCDRIDEFARTVDSLCDTQSAEENPVLPSDVRRFNDLACGEQIAVSPLTAEIISVAKETYQLTDGAYDPTVYRLVDLWGFSSRTYFADGNLPYDRTWQRAKDGSYYYPLPDEKYVEAFKSLCNFNSVELTENDGTFYLKKNCPSVTVDGVCYSQWLDLGGVAKGYVVDGVKKLLDDSPYRSYFVNCGSSSMAFSTQDGEPFTVGLENPFDYNPYFPQENYAKLSVENCLVSTSGQYVRCYAVNGVNYSHVINALTGYPVSGEIPCITLLGNNAAVCDCLTTALSVLGKDNAISFINGNYAKENGLKVVFVYSPSDLLAHGKQIVTNLTKQDFLSLNSSFRYAVDISDGTVYYRNQVSLTPLWVAVAVVVAVLLVIAVVKGKGQTFADRFAVVKKHGFFAKGDLAVYALTLVLVAVLFGTFVFGATSKPIETVAVESTFSGEKIFSVDVVGRRWQTYQSENYSVDVTQSGSKLSVRITSHIHNDSFNLLEVDFDGKSVKMIDADCGVTKECVNSFGAITTNDGIIICNPNGLKVVVGESDYVLI